MLTDYSTEKSIALVQDNQLSFQAENETDLFEDKNSIIVESTHFISNLNLISLWKYRELFYFLALRDVKIRYKQTVLGVMWVLLQPIITTLIFTQIAFRLGTSQDLNIPYPLFAFSGFMLWVFVNSAINNSSSSLLNHTSLITKVYFPKLLIPLSAVAATMLDLAFGLISLFIAMLIYGVSLSWRNLLVLLLLIPTLLLISGLGILTASLNVKYRDIKYILPFVLQVFFFISPVFYPLSIIPKESIWLWQLNPFTGILETFRALLFNQTIDFYSLSISIVISLLIFFLAIYVFHQMEDDFADVI